MTEMCAKKKKDVDEETLKRIRITTIYCEPATPEGKMFLLLFFQFSRYFSPCLCYTLARKMKSLFPVCLLFIVLWLQKLAASCNENCHWKHYNIMSNHTTRYFHITSKRLLWKTRVFSYERITDMLNMVFHSLSFFCSAFFNLT